MMNDQQGRYSQWPPHGQQAPYAQQPTNQAQWNQQPPLKNSPQSGQLHPPSLSTQQTQYYAGKFQTPYPTYALSPQKPGGWEHSLPTQTRAVKIGRGCAAFIFLLFLCLCSVAASVTLLSTIIPSVTPLQPGPTTCPANGGVSKNPDGTYHFSWLHIAGGKIADQQNCLVTLLGFNTSGIEYGDGVGGFLATRIKTFARTFNMNLWRLAISPVWWNANDYVPAAHMKYQDWVKQLIAWMEQNGNYIEIDPTSYHTIAPAARGPFCSDNNNTPPCWTSQDTPNNPPWTEQQMIAAAQQFWQSITPLYKNDPAILYDALNEPVAVDFPNFTQDLNLLINTIQAINPKAVVFVYYTGVDQLIAGVLPDYSQSNLIFTFHPYPDPHNPWQDKLFLIQQVWVPWIQSHNHGISIEEWGDPNLPSDTGYANGVLSLVKTYGAVATYYQEHNAMWGNLQLSDAGRVLQQKYASLPPVILR